MSQRFALPSCRRVTALLAAGVLSCSAWGQPAATGATPEPAAARGEIRAQLLPRRYTTLAAEIGARIQRMPLAEGDSFVQGQSLLRFDCSLQTAQRDKASAELDAAEQTHRANQRMAELNAVGQLELDLSRSAVKRARAELDAQEAIIAKCDIAAPFSGRVAEQKVREQQFVQPGQALMDVLDDSVMELEFLVPSGWLRWLRAGQPLRVQIDETRKSYPARFIRIGARVDPVSQSVKVAAAIDGRFPELVAGMSGRVQVNPASPAATSAK